MGEDDIVELLCQSGQIIRSNQSQRPTSDLPILRGSGSGGEEGANASHHNIFIQEDEMASWLQHPISATSTQPQNSVSLAPLPPSALYYSPVERSIRQISGTARAENLMNFTRLRENIIMGHGPWNPTMRETGEVGSSPSSSAMQSSVGTLMSGVSQTFAVPKEKAVAVETVCEIAGTSSSGVCKAETEPIQVQPPTETDEKKRRGRQETIDDIEETKETRGTTSRKRSRAAEMHNISERRRREKINEKMKALQELIPRCNKTDKASMLDDAIEYVKSLQMQVEMMSSGSGMMPMMYTPNMQQFMPHMAMGMTDMNRPPFMPFPGTAFPRPAAHMGSLGPSYPATRSSFPNIQASDPPRVHLPSQQPYQAQFQGYMNPYSQFAGLHQMEQPPPLQNQTTSQLSFTKASSSKEPGGQDNQPIH